MAERFSIDIFVNLKDNTDPGVSSASKKVSAFDRVVEKMQSRVDKATKTKWKVTIEAVDKVTSVISTIGSGIKSVAGKVWSVTMSVVDKVTTPIKKMISVVGDLLGVSTAVSTVLAGLSVKNALTSAAESSRMMTQLNVSASNMGISDSGVQQIVNKATNMQQTTMYSDDAMIGSAAELATYFSDADAITRMMDVVADYAAGMSGGTELSTQEIVDYTTNLAKMTTGAYDAMTKKGFEVTDAQKAILESGTDMEKVAAIEEIIEENWAGMAEAMSNTPTGWLSRLKNAWDDVSKTVGNKLTPGVTSFLSMLTSKMPAVSSLIEDVAESAGSWLEDIVPTLEVWIDDAITWVTNLKDKITEVFGSEEFQNADFFGKISIAWNEIIAEPFSEWWNSTGRAWFADKASSIGEAIGSGLTQGLLALLGIDISETLEDGKTVGGAFIDGFKQGFDTEQIGQALKEWADNNKEIVIGIGSYVGFRFITGMAGKISNLVSKIKSFLGKGSDDTGNDSFNFSGKTSITCTSATVTASVVNVYGAVVNDGGNGNGGDDFVKRLIERYAAKKLIEEGSQLFLGSGGEVGGGLLLGSGEAAGSAAAGSGGMIEMVELADGSFAMAGSGAAGAGGGGAAAGGSALSTLGTAAAGIGGALLAGWGIYDLVTTDSPALSGEPYTMDDVYSYGESVALSGLKTTAGGALIGTAISPGIGTAIGAGVGVLGWGIGEGIKHWNDPGAQEMRENYGDGSFTETTKLVEKGYLTDRLGMDPDIAETLVNIQTAPSGWIESLWGKVKEPLSTFFTSTLPGFFTGIWDGITGFFTETIPEFISNAGEGISTFFTETVPEFFENLWSDIYDFFAEDVPYAIGYAVGSIEVFFTETVPQFFSDLWDGITTFFTDTLPTWLSTIWEGISNFFTVTIPQFFSDLWSGIVTFFTDTLPTWISGVWENISTFFTSTLPQWFSDLWNGIVTFFSETLPTFISTAWEKVTNFFTVTVPGWFESLWNGIVNFVTNIIPSWVSAVGNVISGWGEAIAGWFSSLWSQVQSFFSSAFSSFSAGYSDAGGGKHAWGGIMNAPHYGLVAEDGPEAIIPLSPSKSDRALDLWMQAGRYLGVQPYADGDIVGEPAPVSIQTVPVGNGDGSGQKVQVIVTLSPEFIIQAAGADEESIMAIIRSHLRELADEMGGEIAEQIEEIFKNIPVKGGA